MWLGNFYERLLVCNIWSSNIITNQMFVEMQKGNAHETSMHVKIENNIRSILARRYTWFSHNVWLSTRKQCKAFFYYFTSNENYKPTKWSSPERFLFWRTSLANTSYKASLLTFTSLQKICILFSPHSLQVAPVCL